jgi:hypothetical protein
MTVNFDVVNVSRPAPRWGAAAALADGVELLALTWGLPLAILAVGTPLALAVMLVLWLGRMALGAF